MSFCYMGIRMISKNSVDFLYCKVEKSPLTSPYLRVAKKKEIREKANWAREETLITLSTSPISSARP